MKAAIIEGDKIKIEECSRPTLKAKGAIIKIRGCGLCGSDIVKFKQKISPDGTVLGHEIVGEIQEINSDTGFVKGDRVVMGHHIPCFECTYCKNENFSMCKHFKTTNIKPGGFAEFIFASDEHLNNTAFKIPDEIDDITASFLEPLGCCIRAVERAELKDKSSVLVIGLGSIGLLMGYALKQYNQNIFGFDIIDERVKFAQETGFDYTFNSMNLEKAIDFIKSNNNNLGVDAVFMTSGAAKALPLALKSVRDGGKIVVFSSIPNLDGYANNEIYYRELTIMGAYSPAPIHLKKSADMLFSEKVIVKNISTEYNLEELEKAVCDTTSNKIMKAYIKI